MKYEGPVGLKGRPRKAQGFSASALCGKEKSRGLKGRPQSSQSRGLQSQTHRSSYSTLYFRKIAGGLSGRARGGSRTGVNPCALCGRAFSPEETASVGRSEPLFIHRAPFFFTPLHRGPPSFRARCAFRFAISFSRNSVHAFGPPSARILSRLTSRSRSRYSRFTGLGPSV